MTSWESGRSAAAASLPRFLTRGDGVGVPHRTEAEITLASGSVHFFKGTGWNVLVPTASVKEAIWLLDSMTPQAAHP